MEDTLFSSEKQKLVSSFLEIAVGQTSTTARQFLQATSWKLEEAIQLFFVGNEGGAVTSSAYFPPEETTLPPIDQSASGVINDATKHIAGVADVRPPLPVIRKTLYDDAMLFGTTRHPPQGSSVAAFRNFEDKNRNPAVWSSGQGGPSTTESSHNKLAALYRPPFELMHEGPFEKAKLAAADADKWLVANLQSNTEFSSHMLNRDTWANEAVAETIKTNFIFWQVYDDTSEGKKVCTYYKIESVPVILIIDPITGQKMRSWSGMVHPDRLLEDLLAFTDGGPKNHHSSLSNNRPREIIPKHIQKAQVYYIRRERMEQLDGLDVTYKAHPTQLTQDTWRAMSLIKIPSTKEESNDEVISSDMVIGVVDGYFHFKTLTSEDLFGDSNVHDLHREWMGGTNARFPLNKKVIGAKQFSHDNKIPKTWVSRDDDNHGSACAAVACGNYVPASYFNISKGFMRGSCPKAKVALYQCIESKRGGLPLTATLDAILAAVDDEVDILSISLGCASMVLDKSPTYKLCPLGKGTLDATLKGILCCVSGGNIGRVARARNTEPWQLSVGACSNSKRFCTKICLGNKKTLKARSTNLFKRTGLCPLVFADDVSERSKDGSALVLSHKKVKGKILYCKNNCNPNNDDGTIARRAGVKGIIYLETIEDAECDKHILSLPAASVHQSDFDIIAEYCKSEPNPMVEIFQTVEVDDDDQDYPVLLNFSSKGPNSRAFDLVKPDICAPGQLIVPCSTPLKAIVKGVEKSSLYCLMLGTSASCPLVGGAMAFLKSIHRDWSPAALKSSVMTTADEMRIKSDEDILGVGSGVLNVTKAQDPGLVYDIEPMTYLHYLRGMGFYFESLNKDCERLTELVKMAMKETLEIHPHDLNEPNLGASFEDTETTYTFRRRLKNVGRSDSTYTCHVKEIDGLVIVPVPNELYFKDENDEASYELQVEVVDWNKGNKYGFRTCIEWRFEHYIVRSWVVITKSSAILAEYFKWLDRDE